VVISAISFFETVLEKAENTDIQQDNLKFAAEKIINAQLSNIGHSK